MNIFVDLDGTLIDIKSRHYFVYCECVKKFRGQPLAIELYWRMKRDDEKWHEILKKSSITEENEGVFLKEFIKLVEDPDVLAQDTLFGDSIDTLQNLSKTHQLFLLSLRRDDTALRNQVASLGIDGYFMGILSGHSDTKAESLEKKADVVKSAGLSGQRLLLIGDTEADIVAAQSLGAPCIAVTTGIRSPEILATYRPDKIVSAISEVLSLSIIDG